MNLFTKYVRTKIQNNELTLAFANVIPILEKGTPVTETNAQLFNDSPLIICVQSIPRVFLLQFGKNNRDYYTLSFSPDWRFMTSLFQVGIQKYIYECLLM